MFGNTLGPDQSFRFARGEEVISSTGLRVRLNRPLDFLVVSDHAEYLGLADLLAKGDPQLLATEAGKEWVALAGCSSPVRQAPVMLSLSSLQEPGNQQAATSPSESEERDNPQERMTPPPAFQEQEEEKTWSFLIRPYVLFVNIDGDASVGRLSGVDLDIDTGDVLGSLELAGMINAEAFHKSGWGVVVDYAFMDLEDDHKGPFGRGLAEVEVFQGVFEAFGAYRFETELATVDAFAGIRWWDIELDVDFSLGPLQDNRTRKSDWIDPVVGARAHVPIGDRWFWLVHGDIGGFGVESDFSWQAITGFGYRFSDLFSIDLRYRAIGVDYEEGTSGMRSHFEYDTITHGPTIGFGFHF